MVQGAGVLTRLVQGPEFSHGWFKELGFSQGWFKELGFSQGWFKELGFSQGWFKDLSSHMAGSRS
jgi:hypothetical protein